MKKLVIASLLICSVSAFAGTENKIVINGKGYDGHPCSVEITRDGEMLKGAKLQGSTEDFEIIAETQKGYGPKKSVSSRGADQILEMFVETPKLFGQFEYSFKPLTNKEVYTLSTKDLVKDSGKAPDTEPKSAGKGFPRKLAKDADDDQNDDEQALKHIAGTFKIEVQYSGSEVVAVKAETKFKALKFITLARKTFVCETE